MRRECDAFVPVLPSSHCCRVSPSTSSSPLLLDQQRKDVNDNDDDDDELFGNNNNEEFDDENEPVDTSWGEQKLNALTNTKLGITNLISFTNQDISEISNKAALIVDEAFTTEINAIDTLKVTLQTSAQEGKEIMNMTSILNRQFEIDNLVTKIDSLTNNFLDSTVSSRDDIHRLVTADTYTSNMGMGVMYGSWGNIGDGEVGIDTTATTAAAATGVLLGSVEQSQQQQQQQNRVLIIADTKKDKSSLLIITELSTILHKTFHPSSITIDIVTPNTVPMGGMGAQTVILFGSALDTITQSSFDSIITNRVLKRIAPMAGQDPIRPPSHVVLISTHGTERTNKLPYSMMNIMNNGKLDKLRNVERGLVALSRRSGSSSRAVALDYTIIKFGTIDTKYDNNNSISGDCGDVTIRYEDVLDGSIGPRAAANVILQSTVYQPYARNTTLCAQQEGDRGGSSIMMLVDDDTATSSGSDSSMMMLWNDKFLCLSGPELLRINVVVNKKDTITSNDYESLLSYITLWSESYDSSSSTIPKKGTGLTTPVIVRPSCQQPSIYDGVTNRSGVRILFRPTNTGDRYKSATEERLDEKTRTSGSSGAAKKGGATVLPMSKERKEGGVEVLVERTLSDIVRVRARRCNIDDKTIVKEMSEDVIISSLKKAMDAWIISQPDICLEKINLR